MVRGLLVSMVVLASARGRAAAQPEAPAGSTACGVAAGVEDRPDEVLYNAGVCYEQGGAAADAIAAFQELRARFPRSLLAARALGRLGNLYARSARYQEAAASLEEYARKYAGEHDAAAAISDATFYRKSIGDDDQAIADTHYFIRTFGGKRPGEVAGAFFSLASIYEKRGKLDDLLKHLRAYLKTYGAKGGADRVVIAHARIGQILWDQSCRVKTIDGACIQLAPARAAQCGPASKRAVTAVARDGRKVKEAMAAFAAAVAQYERAGGRFPGGDELGARYHYAFARFYRAEADFEAFLGVEFPAGLDFDPARPAETRKSSARFATWLQDKQRLGEKASAAYGTLIFEVRDPTNAIAAAARTGQIALHVADALYTAEVPAVVARDKVGLDAYCDALTTAAEPYESKAVDGFAACLKASTDFGWFSSWSALCEGELGRLRPEEFPTASELRARQAPTSTLFDLEPPIEKLP